MSPVVKSELLEKLWARMSERGDFPMLSQALRSTVSAMNNDDLDFTSLVQVVLSDVGLTQKVLRLANSAMYVAFGGNITTVTRALMVLGMDTVGHLVVGMKIVDHFHQSAPHRIDAKLELNRALLCGTVARRITEGFDLRVAEEAVVCALMRQIGRLLVAFYLEGEWDRLRRTAASEEVDDSEACAMLLGVSFEDIGIEAARRWRLPETISAGMQAIGAPSDEPLSEQVRWLRAVNSYATEVGNALVTHAPGDELAGRLTELAALYSDALRMDASRLAHLSAALIDEESSEGLMQEISELRAHADAIVRTGKSAQARLSAGLEDLRALPSSKALSPVLTLASETILAGLSLSRTLVFVRQADARYHARIGFGPDMERMLPTLNFGAGFQPDVFHLAIANPVGIFIENAHEPRMEARLPDWFKAHLADAEAFVLLPVRAKDTTVALVYGDWTGPAAVHKITQPEMAVLNELTRELSRFFYGANLEEAEML
ncbi:HDOD domain-containing protein [Paraburkholderia phymatum]|uniref:Putative signal transduction protein n=1 Tax=Paraburkholderia phymatum (strain DSM 17167 / CIP 108236 / LMG 21445 / STM815) TaxID=391038 RepID=B2JV76_PARP8|nr:HDOD domain-containing protein [Paraburkholderia phymatum]ACC74853.1 putative signal transduction protein [Paraburkholderia phymatum STM815]